MHDIFIFIKGLLIIFACWSLDFMLIQFAGLSIINSPFRELILEIKDVINLIVTLAVLYLTYLKIKKVKKDE